jgi:CO/xanthine dehydrogenase Mo-binding subunit
MDAVKMASELIAHRPGVKLKPFSTPNLKFIGVSLPDIDGTLKVKGELKFADDMYLEDMGHGKILWSQYPHAEILSIDVSRAEKVDGVRAVLTAKDVPGRIEFGILKLDQPVLADKKVRFLGDPVALVIADSQRAASKAVKQISVRYRELEGVFSPQEAIRPEAPLLYENGNIMWKIEHTVGDIERLSALIHR